MEMGSPSNLGLEVHSQGLHKWSDRVLSPSSDGIEERGDFQGAATATVIPKVEVLEGVGEGLAKFRRLVL